MEVPVSGRYAVLCVLLVLFCGGVLKSGCGFCGFVGLFALFVLFVLRV